MNLGMFDNIDGLILRERENNFVSSAGHTDERKRPEMNNGANMSEFPRQTPLAMAYVPFQSWGEVRSAEEALAGGTLFPALDFPFMEGGGLR